MFQVRRDSVSLCHLACGECWLTSPMRRCRSGAGSYPSSGLWNRKARSLRWTRSRSIGKHPQRLPRLSCLYHRLEGLNVGLIEKLDLPESWRIVFDPHYGLRWSKLNLDMAGCREIAVDFVFRCALRSAALYIDVVDVCRLAHEADKARSDILR